MNNCIVCQTELAPHNKSGYCIKCYHLSPASHEYQKNYHLELRKDPKFLKKVKAYNRRPEVRERTREYNKGWVKRNRKRMNELKRKWANKPENKAKRKMEIKENE